ncbi:MAG TPA: hypothetical protein VFS37_01450 [Conexibacter sp.]|nr:hypothetical protein [Conexibacter sp.]
MSGTAATDPADVVLTDAHWRVVVAPARGMLIREALDVASGAVTLWRQEPADGSPFSCELPPGGPASAQTFAGLFEGGWFPLFPAAGFVGELDGIPTLYHGELARLPWEVADRGPSWVEVRVRTVRAPFAVTRRVVLDGGELRIETEAVNDGDVPASFTYGEHPCFPHATFAGGRLELEARTAWIPRPAFDPERATLALGERFSWPHAPRRDGVPCDLSRLPEAPDRRHDHACVELASSRVRLTAPRHGRALELDVDLAATPYALLWQQLDRDGVFAVEPMSAPGRGVADAVAAGAVRRLGPGERFRTALALRWVDLGPAAS